MYVTQSIISHLRNYRPKPIATFHSISIWNKISAVLEYADALYGSTGCGVFKRGVQN